MRIFFRAYWLPVLLGFFALLVGSLYVATPLAVKSSFASAGKPFLLVQFKTYRNSILQYTGRAREIYQGHFPPSDLSVGGNQPTIMNLLPPSIFAALLSISHGGVTRAYLLAEGIFSALIFLAFYFAVRLITKSNGWAIFAALVGTLTPIATLLPFYKWHSLFDFSRLFVQNFLPIVRTQTDKLYLTLVDNPLLTWPFFLTAIALFYRFWKNPKTGTAAAAAVSAGLLFYVYFHFWVYWVITAGLLFLYTLVRERKDKAKLKSFLVFWGILLLIAIPYVINYFRFSALPSAHDYSYRLGIANGRVLGITAQNLPDFVVYGLLAAAVYFLYWRKGNKSTAIFFWAALAAMAVAWNVQLVIGYVPVPHTWYKTFSQVIFLMLFALAYETGQAINQRWPKAKKILAIAVIILTAALVVKRVYNIVSIRRQPQQFIADYYNFPKELTDAWHWMNANLKPDSRVLSSSTMTSFYLNTYTNARPYVPTGFTTLLPMTEIENRFLNSQKLFGVSEKLLLQRLEGTVPMDCKEFQCFPDMGSSLNDSAWHLYGGYMQSTYGNFYDFLGDTENAGQLTAQREARYQELLVHYRQINPDWQNVGADYIFYGPWERGISKINLGADQNLRLVYKNSLVEIYQIKK